MSLHTAIYTAHSTSLVFLSVHRGFLLLQADPLKVQLSYRLLIVESRWAIAMLVRPFSNPSSLFAQAVLFPYR